MGRQRKNRISAFHGAVFFAFVFFSAVVMTFIASSLASEDAVTETPWTCPVDPAMTLSECGDAIAENPESLTYDDLVTAFGPDAVKPLDERDSDYCQQSGDKVECNGNGSANLFYIGKHQGQFTICVFSGGYEHFDVSTFSLA